VKAGSSSAVAFGRVLQAVRQRRAQNQAAIAGRFDPKLSVAAVSMAEGGNRPPKTEALVRKYAAALELDDDTLVELWWATQGLVEEDDPGSVRAERRWWRRMRPSIEAETRHHFADAKAQRERDPNHEVCAPSLELISLAERVCDVLKRLLGADWQLDYTPELGLYDPIEGRRAGVSITMSTSTEDAEQPDAGRAVVITFACPEPAAGPAYAPTADDQDGTVASPEMAWILSEVEAMSGRERRVVAAFIRGLKEGASLYSAAGAAGLSREP
jgi:hypothetical protein